MPLGSFDQGWIEFKFIDDRIVCNIDINTVDVITPLKCTLKPTQMYVDQINGD